MTDNLKTALDGIRAKEELKIATSMYLRKEIARRKKAQKYAMFKRYSAAAASAVILFMSGIFAHMLYFTPTAYLDVDINPSMELMLNRLDRVIGVYPYNDDGGDVINNLSLTHKSYDAALVILMETMTREGYFQDAALVSVTLQTDDKSKENALLNSIQAGIEEYLTDHHATAQIDVFPVSSDTRSHSHEQGISPAKYLAIQELIEIDPTASIESCRNHSINEIKQLVQNHGSHHDNSDVPTNSPYYDENINTPPNRGNGHHKRNGHRSGH